MSRSTAAEPVTGTGWQAVADELADALQEAMLRNPSLTARGWDRAHAALGRYERAGVGELAEPPESHKLLSGCLAWARRQEHLATNPALGLGLPNGTTLAPPRRR